MIDFEWAMHERTAERFDDTLRELGIETRATSPDGEDARADDAVFALLERAGLMLDQQIQTPQSGERTFRVGRADAATLARALLSFGRDGDAGGVLIDMATSPAQLTEIRGINSRIVVLADGNGARQLPLETDSIAFALEHAEAAPGEEVGR